MLIRLECRNIDYSQTVLYWAVEPEFKEDVNSYGYIIQISESPNGEWIDLFSNLILY